MTSRKPETNMPAFRSLTLAYCLMLAGPALAQQAGQAPPANADGADQVVGLFGAACMQFAGNPTGVRGFLAQQGAPQMPQQARDAFLAGRSGQAFDVSFQNVRLALVSLDDGGCEAVADKADPAAVVATLQAEAKQNGVTLQSLGAQPDKARAGVRHDAYSAIVGGKQMHVLVSTAPTPPQAVLTLAPN
jgi:hypothetical protein